jgi:streptomycin 6-kinase
MVDLTAARKAAYECAARWSLEIGAQYALSNVSFVAPTSDGNVLKSDWRDDDESLHEADALALWDGDGAVRLVRRSGRVLLEQRAIPGSDLSVLSNEEANPIAVDLASRLWRPATPPFRPVGPEVARWLYQGDVEGGPLVSIARELFEAIGGGAGWVVHGDFHHHNILKMGEGYVAIDPKPYLADREYDVAAFLWNPMNNHMSDAAETERRIAAFVGSGLDDFRIRAWAVIRGSYLRTDSDYSEALRALIL